MKESLEPAEGQLIFLVYLKAVVEVELVFKDYRENERFRQNFSERVWKLLSETLEHAR